MKKEQKETASKTTDDLLVPSKARFIVLPLVYLISVTFCHIWVWDIIERIGYNFTVKLTFIIFESLLPIAVFAFFMLKRFRIKQSKLVLLIQSLILMVLPFISFFSSVIVLGLISVCFFGLSA